MKEKNNYGVYKFGVRDWLEFLIRILIKGVVICYLFYDSYKAGILLIPFIIFDYKALRQQKHMKQKRELIIEFRSLIESLVTSLNAGYSLESAFEEAKKDLMLVYDKEAFILAELDHLIRGLKLNIPLEQSLKDFGMRSGIEDIQNFANVISAAKRGGGNLIHIIQKTINSIGDKLQVEEEIATMISAKTLESKIMLVMPYGIIFYLRLCNGAFLDVLYHNALGVMIMTAFLFLMCLARMWAERIMEIVV